jgi:hypothetical protein
MSRSTGIGTPSNHNTIARPNVGLREIEFAGLPENNAESSGRFPMKYYMRFIQLFTWLWASSLAMP